jgi:hypothetical protein
MTTAEMAHYIAWLEQGLKFIAEGKTSRPSELAQQILDRHVWLPEWNRTCKR